MTENPFKFNKNSRKFIQQLEKERIEPQTDKLQDFLLKPHERLYQDCKSQIRFSHIGQLEEQTLKLAKQRQNIISNDPAVNEMYTGRLPKMSKTFHVQAEKFQKDKTNNLFQQKKDVIKVYVLQKRNLFMANMNINIKKEETKRLVDLIKNEEESLKSREKDIQNDWVLISDFMKEVSNKADSAQIEYDKERKLKDENNNKIYTLENEIDKIQNQINRNQEELNDLIIYRDFIEKLGIRIKPQELKQNNFFITDELKKEEVDLPFDDSKQILLILEQIEEKNLNIIQNTNEAEALQESQNQELKDASLNYQNKIKDLKERLIQLEKTQDEALQKNVKGQKLKTMDQNCFEFSEGKIINMVQIGKQIKNIYVNLPNNNQSKTNINQSQNEVQIKEIYKSINVIEKILIQDGKWRQLMYQDPICQKFLEKQEKTLKDKYKNYRIAKEQQEVQDQKHLLQQEKDIKKKQAVQKINKGRKNMNKVFLQKEKKSKIVEKIDDHNDDEKYLKDSFYIGMN